MRKARIAALLSYMTRINISKIFAFVEIKQGLSKMSCHTLCACLPLVM